MSYPMASIRVPASRHRLSTSNTTNAEYGVWFPATKYKTYRSNPTGINAKPAQLPQALAPTTVPVPGTASEQSLSHSTKPSTEDRYTLQENCIQHSTTSGPLLPGRRSNAANGPTANSRGGPNARRLGTLEPISTQVSVNTVKDVSSLITAQADSKNKNEQKQKVSSFISRVQTECLNPRSPTFDKDIFGRPFKFVSTNKPHDVPRNTPVPSVLQDPQDSHNHSRTTDTATVGPSNENNSNSMRYLPAAGRRSKSPWDAPHEDTSRLHPPALDPATAKWQTMPGVPSLRQTNNLYGKQARPNSEPNIPSSRVGEDAVAPQNRHDQQNAPPPMYWLYGSRARSAGVEFHPERYMFKTNPPPKAAYYTPKPKVSEPQQPKDKMNQDEVIVRQNLEIGLMENKNGVFPPDRSNSFNGITEQSYQPYLSKHESFAPNEASQYEALFRGTDNQSQYGLPVEEFPMQGLLYGSLRKPSPTNTNNNKAASWLEISKRKMKTGSDQETVTLTLTHGNRQFANREVLDGGQRDSALYQPTPPIELDGSSRSILKVKALETPPAAKTWSPFSTSLKSFAEDEEYHESEAFRNALINRLPSAPSSEVSGTTSKPGSAKKVQFNVTR